MWVFKNDAFVSLVQDRDMPDQLWARARVRGHLEAFFGEDADVLEVIETPNADYAFRAAVARADVASVLCKSAADVRYENFKKSIPMNRKGDRYHDALMKVWSAMHALQVEERRLDANAARERARKRGKKKGPRD
jgi:hypothetical protein